MKINYTYEQTQEETQVQEEAIKSIVDKVLNFGEKMFNIMITDKNAASQRSQNSELLQAINALTRKVESLEASVNSREYSFKK